MARLRFPGRPGHRFDRLSVKYFSDDVKNIQDPSLAFLPQFQRGLKAFRDLVGLSDEDDEFEGFTSQDVKISEKKLNAFIKEQKKKEQAQVAETEVTSRTLSVTGKRRSKSLKKCSVSELASQVNSAGAQKEVFPYGRGVKIKDTKLYEHRNKPKKFKLDLKHGIPGAKTKKSEIDMAKFLLEKAKQANALQEQAKARKLATVKSPVPVQKKTFVLPSQSSRSSRVIKPNKRFLEDDCFHSIVKKKSKPSISSVDNSSSKFVDEKLCFSPELAGNNSADTSVGLLDLPLIVNGKRDRKPSLKLQLSDDDQPLLSPIQSSITSPLAAPKLGTSLFSKSQFQKASDKQKLGIMGFGSSRLHGASIVQKAKLQLNRAALNKSKAALARSLKAEMKREAKFAEQAKHLGPDSGAALLSPSKLKADVKKPKKWKTPKRCLVCGKRNDLTSCYGNLIACTSCRRFYRECTGNIKVGSFVAPVCHKNDKCNLAPDKIKCRYCRTKKLLEVGFPSVPQLEALFKDGVETSKQDAMPVVHEDVITVKSPLSTKKATKPPSAFPAESGALLSPNSNVKGVKKSIQSPPPHVEIPALVPTIAVSSITPDTESKEQELSPLKAGESSEKRHRKKRAFKELLKNKQEKIEDSVADTSFERPVIHDSPPQVVTGSVEVSPREGGPGPRIKHVCRNAAVVLGQPLATFPEKSELRLSALPTKDKVQLWKKDEESKAASAESDDERPMEDIIQQSSDSVVIMKKTPSKLKATKKLTGAGGLHLYKRKMRCKTCDGCRRQDCGVCRHCKDMKKFGGPGTVKKACEERTCKSPLIQRSATEAFIIEKKIKRSVTMSHTIRIDDNQSDDEDKLCTETDVSQGEFGSTCDFDSIIPGSQSSQTVLGIETQTGTLLDDQTQSGTLLDDQTQSNNNMVNKCSDKASLKPGNHSDAASTGGVKGPSTKQTSPSKNSRAEVRKLTFEEIPDFRLERISTRNKKSGKLPSKQAKKLDMQEKYSKKQGGNDGQCYPVSLQSVLPASRQWGSLLSQSRYHPIKVDYKGKRDMASCWKYGMSLTLSTAMSVRTLCILCGSTGKHDLVYCNICCEPYHEFCLEDWEQPSSEHYDDWICAACQFCHVCGRQNNLLQCDKCQNTYHPGCLGPNYPTQPSKRKRIWICTKCVKCKSCGATTPGSGSQATWTYDFSLCYECGQLMDKGNFCPICHKCYSDDDWESKMIQCNKCDSWVHSKCEGLTDEMYEILSCLPEDLSFFCRKCFPYGCPEWERTLKRELQLGLESILHTLILSKSSQYILKHEQKKLPLKPVKSSSEHFGSEEANKVNIDTNSDLPTVHQASDMQKEQTTENLTGDINMEGRCLENCSAASDNELLSVGGNADYGKSNLLANSDSCLDTVQDSSEVVDKDKESLTKTSCDSSTQNAEKLFCDQVSDNVQQKSCDNVDNEQINMQCSDASNPCANSRCDNTLIQTSLNSCDNVTGCDFNHSTADTIQDARCNEKQVLYPLPNGEVNEVASNSNLSETSGCANAAAPGNTVVCSVNEERSSEISGDSAVVRKGDDLNRNCNVVNSATSVRTGAEVNNCSTGNVEAQVHHSAKNIVVPVVTSSVAKPCSNDTKKSNHVHFNEKENNMLALKDNAEALEDTYPKDLMEIAQQMRTGCYKSVVLFCEDILRVIQTYLDDDDEIRMSRKKAVQSARSIFVKQLEKVFPWFNVKNCRHWYSMKSLPDGMLTDATLPPSTDHTYAQWLERRELPRSPQPSPFKKRHATPVKKFVPLDDDDEFGLGQLFEGDDERKCMFCQTFGDQDGNDAGRLLYCGQDDWCHINCALWSAEVYEDEDGALENLPEAFSRGKMLRCDRCGKMGATVGCNTRGCKSNYHFMCARQDRCRFQEDKKVFCDLHRMFIDRELITPDGFNVLRRVYVGALNVRTVKKRWSKGLHCADVSVLIGSCCVEALGRLTDLSDLPKYLQPVDFIATRMYWSTRDARRRCVYTCRIVEVRPEALKSPTVQIKDTRIVHDPTHPDYVPITSLDLTGLSLDHDQSSQQSTGVEMDSAADASTFDQTTEVMDVLSKPVVSEINSCTKISDRQPLHEVTKCSKKQDSRRASFEGISSIVTSSSSEHLSKSWPVTRPNTTKDTLKSGLSFLSPKTLKMLNMSDPNKYMKPIQNEDKAITDDDNEFDLLKIADRLNKAAAKCSIRKNDVKSPLLSRSDAISPLSMRSGSRSPSVERITSLARPFSPIVDVRRRSQSVDIVSEIRPFFPLSSAVQHKLSGLPETPFSPPARILNRSKSLSVEKESFITKQTLIGPENNFNGMSLLSGMKTGSLDYTRRGRSVSDPLHVVPEPVNFSSPVSNSKLTVPPAANVFTESEDAETSMEVDNQSTGITTSESENPYFESVGTSTDAESKNFDMYKKSETIESEVTSITDETGSVSHSTDTDALKGDIDTDYMETSLTIDDTIDGTTETIIVMTESGESLSEEDAIKIVQDMINKKQLLSNSDGIKTPDDIVNTVVEGLVDAVDARISDNLESQVNENIMPEPLMPSEEINPASPFVPMVAFESNEYHCPGRNSAKILNDNNILQETNEDKSLNNSSGGNIDANNTNRDGTENASGDGNAANEEDMKYIILDDNTPENSDDDIIDITDSVRKAASSHDLHGCDFEGISEKSAIENGISRKRIVYDLDESIDSDIELLDDNASESENCVSTEINQSSTDHHFVMADVMLTKDKNEKTLEQNVNHESNALADCEHVNVDEIDGDKEKKINQEVFCGESLCYDGKGDSESYEFTKQHKEEPCADTELDSSMIMSSDSEEFRKVNSVGKVDNSPETDLNKYDHVDVTNEDPVNSPPTLSQITSVKTERSFSNSSNTLSPNLSIDLPKEIENHGHMNILEKLEEDLKNDSSLKLPVLDPIAKKIKEESIAKSCPGEKGPFKCSKCRRMYRTESSYRVHAENCNFLVSSSDDDDVNGERDSEDHLSGTFRLTRSSKLKCRYESEEKVLQNVNEDSEATKRLSLRQSTQCQRLALEVEEKRMKDDDVPKRRGRPCLRLKEVNATVNEVMLENVSLENEPKGKMRQKKCLDNSGNELKTITEGEKCGKLSAREMRRKSREIKILESLSQSSDSEDESKEQMKNKISNRKRSHSKNDSTSLNSNDDVSKSPVAKRKLRSTSINAENKCEASQEFSKEHQDKFEDKEARNLLKSQVEQLRSSRKKTGNCDNSSKDVQNSSEAELNSSEKVRDNAEENEYGLKKVSVQLHDITSNVGIQKIDMDKDRKGSENYNYNEEVSETMKEESGENERAISTNEGTNEMVSGKEIKCSSNENSEEDNILDPETGWIVDKSGKKIWSPTAKRENDDIIDIIDNNEEKDQSMGELALDENSVVDVNAADEKMEVNDVIENAPCDNVSSPAECPQSLQNNDIQQPDKMDADEESQNKSACDSNSPASEKPGVSNAVACTMKQSSDSKFSRSLPVAVLKLLKEGHKVVIKNPKLDQCFIWQKTADGYIGKPFEKTLVKNTLPVFSKAKKSEEMPPSNNRKTVSDVGTTNKFKQGIASSSVSTSAMENAGSSVSASTIEKPKSASEILLRRAMEEKKEASELLLRSIFDQKEAASGPVPVTSIDKMLVGQDPDVREKIAANIDRLIEGNKQHKASNPNSFNPVVGSAEYVGGVIVSPSNLSPEALDSVKQKIKSTVPIASDILQHNLVQKNCNKPGSYVENMLTNQVTNIMQNQHILPSTHQFISQPSLPFMQHQIQTGTNIVTGVRLSYGTLAMTGLQTLPVSTVSPYLSCQPKLQPQQPHQFQYQQLTNLPGIQGIINVPVVSNMNMSNTQFLSTISDIGHMIPPQTTVQHSQVVPQVDYNAYNSILAQNHSVLTKALTNDIAHNTMQNIYTQNVKSPVKQFSTQNTQGVDENKPSIDKEKASGLPTTIVPALGGCNPSLMKKMQTYISNRSKLNIVTNTNKKKAKPFTLKSEVNNGFIQMKFKSIVEKKNIHSHLEKRPLDHKYFSVFPNKKGSYNVTDNLKKKFSSPRKKKKPGRKPNNKSSGLSLPHKSDIASHPIIHGQKEVRSVPVAAVEEEVRDIPLTAWDENEGGSARCERLNLGHLEYEITSDDGFSCRADTLDGAWKQVTEKVQDARTASRLKHLSYAGLSGLQLFGLSHPNVVYLIEQLYGASYIRRYKFKYHRHEMVERELELLNPTGCIRTEQFSGRNPWDMFSFLMSQYRNLPEKSLKYVDEEIAQKSSRRATSMDLPMAMRFRKLKHYSRECVGVYRSTIHGRGLFCKRSIDAGEMIIEYAGEVIRTSMTDIREKYYESKGIGCYMFRIDDTDVVDATMKGSAARFINHSCDPNCYSKVITVDNRKHIVIFGMRKIVRGEELTYDYKFPIEEVKIPCTCGSKKCRKYLN